MAANYFGKVEARVRFPHEAPNLVAENKKVNKNMKTNILLLTLLFLLLAFAGGYGIRCGIDSKLNQTTNTQEAMAGNWNKWLRWVWPIYSRQGWGQNGWS
jgi:hypothetical protein